MTKSVVWGEWFGSFATRAAARRYVTMNFTGPKVADRDCFAYSQVKQVDGRWQARIAEWVTQ